MHWSKKETLFFFYIHAFTEQKKKRKRNTTEVHIASEKRGRKKFANIYQRHCETS
jgi:hypothetical protein